MQTYTNPHVVIKKERYLELMVKAKMFENMMARGVENWEHYDDSLEGVVDYIMDIEE